MKIPRTTLATFARRPWSARSFFRGIIGRSLLVMAGAVGLPGCATLVTDDHQSIVITSDPPGAACQVRQGGGFVGVVSETPGTILVAKSRHDIAIDCTRPGYYPGAAVLESHLQEMTFGNILYGGTIGLLVDTSSGAIKEYPRWVAVLMHRQPLPGESPAETQRLSEIEIGREHALRERFVRQ